MTRDPAVPYIAPFVAYILFLALSGLFPSHPQLLYPLRFAAVLGILLFVSRPVISFRTSNALGSALLGVAVFAIWVGPDVLFPGYRSHWLFENSITGKAATSLPDHLTGNSGFLAMRIMGSVLLIPILEELFWRGWLMRWLISKEFLKVPLGAYTASSFWIVALLFASEHGSFWEVGLITGLIYNWWMVRTRNLADCMLAHAVTNGCLGAYVIGYGQWQYWL